MLLFAVSSLLVIFFFKTQVYPTVDEYYEPTISFNEVDGLSDTEIVDKLFTMYLEHYKDKPIFNDQNIEDYKLIGTTPIKYAVADGTVFNVSYLIQQHFWNEYWGIGSSGQEKDGMTRQMVFVSLIKEKEQLRLKVKGTGL